MISCTQALNRLDHVLYFSNRVSMTVDVTLKEEYPKRLLFWLDRIS
jgi:hypothetical protein